MSLHAALCWLALQLQVDQPQRWSRWLLRLLVLPPAGAAPVSIDPQQVPDLTVWLAAALQVEPGAPWHRWLLRLVWLPPRKGDSMRARLVGQRRAAAQNIYRVGGWTGWLLAQLWTGVVWPLRMLIRWLEWLAQRYDYGRIGASMERVLEPIVAIPGVRWLIVAVALQIGVVVLSTPFSALGQFLFRLVCWMSSMVLRRMPGRFPAIGLALVSLIALGRYVWWRLTTTLGFDSAAEAALGYGLLAAEAYTWLIVILGFIQTAWPLKREPAALPADRSTWPTVDVFIPSYNESLSVVRPTVLAAMEMDWPADKLRIFILDDGRRPDFREFAAAIGVNYMVRPNNKHAKAGNLNHALAQTDGELVSIFDCDHIPTRGFLTTCVGWFLRDPKCAMLQTPHHFFSPDPFERNLGTFRRVPNEGSLFYGLIQDGNDFWDATFFCGSCAVIRRGPLMEVGGIAVETVTEDAHTALKLHRRGYSTSYINIPLAAGLATESLSAHVGQRIRWARGMAQIFRVDNPLLGVGLTLWQRLCYSTAMLHFFFGLPRLVFLTAPMAYLYFQLHIINANALLLALYVLPYIVQSNIANSHVQGPSRHSFWADVYETVLAVYVMVPTTMALINPGAGTFNVTAKGGLVTKSYFDWVISLPYLVLVLLNAGAAVMGVLRLFYFNSNEPTTVILNLIWTVYSMFILGAAIGVAAETRQVRRTHRVETRLPAVVYLDNGQVVHSVCLDFSMTGLGLEVPEGLNIATGTQVHVGLIANGVEHCFSTHVLLSKSTILGVQFDELSLEDEINLVQCTFARTDAWTNWKDYHDTDKPLQGLREIGLLGIQGYKKLAFWMRDRIRDTLLEQQAANGTRK